MSKEISTDDVIEHIKLNLKNMCGEKVCDILNESYVFNSKVQYDEDGFFVVDGKQVSEEDLLDMVEYDINQCDGVSIEDLAESTSDDSYDYDGDDFFIYTENRNEMGRGL